MLPTPGAPADHLFQTLIEYSSSAVVVLDEEGTVTFASRSLARLFGYELSERLGRSGFELLHLDDLAAARKAFAEALANPGRPITLRCRVRHKDGDWRRVDVIGINWLNEPAVKGIVINYQDITERHRTAEALRASEARLRQLVENAQDLIYYCDPHGYFTYVNPAAARVMQFDEDELIGRHFLTLIRPDYRGTAGRLYTRQIADRVSSTYLEFPAVRKDGSSVWVGQHVHLVFEDGAVAAVQAIARDITAQKVVEERLRRSEARYRSLIEGAAYGIYLAGLDGRILDANPALAEMLGYAHVDELRALNMADFYRDPHERAELIDRYASEGFGSADVKWKRKDGVPIIVRLTARVVPLGVEGGERCFEGIAEDITAKRALEEQLRQAQKMEAVGRLARGVAHDFNNVLAAIVGCSDLLLAQLPPDDPARGDAEEIRKAAERGAGLTRQLLAFSRRQALEQKILDLGVLVRGFEGMARRLVGDLVRLTVSGGERALRVRAEPGQIEQILLNLVVNATDAMPEGGTIDVRVEACEIERDADSARTGLPPGPYARMAVRDSGVGIAPEMQRHVFEPFFTTKGPSKGTGLGLSIVYGIAKECGGAVTFTSEPGKGTTFVALFPLVTDAASVD